MAMHQRKLRTLILTALADESLDAPGIVGAISAGSGRLRVGALFSALHQLRVRGLIAVEREAVAGERLRRCYRLTASGCEWLRASADGSISTQPWRLFR
jgi:DNA-binding PadR family transcriptional regulator